MNAGHIETSASKTKAIAMWEAMLRDVVALLDRPGAHHKALLSEAYALFRRQVIDPDELSDLLEQADSALAYAVEALLDRESGE